MTLNDDWDFFFDTRDGAMASCFVNLGVAKGVPQPERPVLTRIAIAMREPRDDGLSSSSEFQALVDAEDALTAGLGPHSAVLVARVTAAGQRRFYYYLRSSTGVADAVGRGLAAFPQYLPADIETRRDPDWTEYFDHLYPTPVQFRHISNRHVVAALQKEGDTLQVLRPVSHWLYFPTESDRDRFASAITSDGFSAEPEDADEGLQAPFGVKLTRDDRVDWPSINALTDALVAAAAPFQGEYDGWEAEVVHGSTGTPDTRDS